MHCFNEDNGGGTKSRIVKTQQVLVDTDCYSNTENNVHGYAYIHVTCTI